MKVATYNLRTGGKAGQRVHWRRVFDASDPDLFLVQETRHPSEYVPHEFWEAHHDQTVWAAVANNPWGSAVYSKQGTVEKIDCAELSGWVVGAEVTKLPTRGKRPLRVFSVHVPTSKHTYVREAHRILDFIGHAADGADLIIGGDFNLTVGIRQEWETLPNRPPELTLIERIRSEFGLVSCWQAANPRRELAQTLRWSRNPALPFHCDGIFVPVSWLSRLAACDVLSGFPWVLMSDHNPVVATFLAEPLPNGYRPPTSTEPQ